MKIVITKQGYVIIDGGNVYHSGYEGQTIIKTKKNEKLNLSTNGKNIIYQITGE